MTLVIGTDEAGYGPNLGPLVVAATAWEVDAAAGQADDRLAEAVACGLAESGIVWADSKRVFRRGDPAAGPLARGVLAAAAIISGSVPRVWRSLAAAVGRITPDPADGEGTQWEGIEQAELIDDPAAAALESVAAAIARRLEAGGVRLVGLACHGIYPARFNRLLEAGENKSDILSRATLALAAGVRGHDSRRPARIHCDRHGGRKRYAAAVGRAFGGVAKTLNEAADSSSYEVAAAPGLFPQDTAATWIGFSVGGERRPPVALASMAAKFVREMAMDHFNRRWAAWFRASPPPPATRSMPAAGGPRPTGRSAAWASTRRRSGGGNRLRRVLPNPACR